jgi:amino acid transporter
MSRYEEERMTLEKRYFVRKASGLVRTVSAVDSMLFSIFAINLGVGAMITYAWALPAFQGGDLNFALILCSFFASFLMLSYALQLVCMPRSGGEYVFISRTIHPVIGFVANWNIAIWSMFWIAMDTAIFTTWVLAPGIAGLGVATNNPFLVDLGTAIYDPVNAFIIGSVVIFFCWLIYSMPIKRYFQMQKIMFIIAMISTITIIALFLTTSRNAFITKFNSFMYPNYSNSTNAYSEIIEWAKKEGINPTASFSWSDTFGMMAPAFIALGYAMWCAYHAGELKEAEKLKSHLISFIGALLFGMVFMIIIGQAYINVIGREFAISVGYLYYMLGLQPTPFAPFYNFFAFLLTDNIVLLWIILIGFIAWGLMWPFICGLPAIRSIFAWSFDGLMPQKLSEVHEKLKSPLIANTLVHLAGWIFLYLYIFTTFGRFLWASIFGSMFTFFFVGMSAAIFPFRQKRIYEASPARISILGVPLISICGVMAMIFSLLNGYYFATNDALFANLPEPVAFTVGILICGFVVFGIAYLYRKRQGIDIMLAYREIPPA